MRTRLSALTLLALSCPALAAAADVPVADKMLVREWRSKAAGWAEDLKRRGVRRLESGYSKHGIDYPGMESVSYTHLRAHET